MGLADNEATEIVHTVFFAVDVSYILLCGLKGMPATVIFLNGAVGHNVLAISLDK
jgi:hypothetical protein